LAGLSYSPAMVRFTVGIKLPIPVLDIGIEDIRINLKRKPRDTEAGPFLIVSRACGLAVDTLPGARSSWMPELRLAEGRRSQLWFLRPSGVANEVLLASAECGLVMDMGRNPDEPLLVVWETHRAAWQRWVIEGTPDGVGCLIRAVHCSRYLAVDERGAPEWKPWLEGRDPQRKAQEWILVQPFSREV
jgi:hypothetical protein